MPRDYAGDAAKSDRHISDQDMSAKTCGNLARVTGLEPATSGVTGRRSNQLSYTRSNGASN
jgi:hypothetical protein